MDGDKRVAEIISKQYYERYHQWLPRPDFFDEKGGVVFTLLFLKKIRGNMFS